MRSFEHNANDSFVAMDDSILDMDPHIGQGGPHIAPENLETGGTDDDGASLA